ncbi:glycosyl hydrolase family 18 protein [Dehalobacter sp. DCM]|uniref:glycosyl hydrolase family 18 protein n=1 Tax=Dehalobacter sp. DCM TaxID=2907827 RepID=UPI003081F81E|nr:glycosyl hydrolase family 18 protein [Dehalobacter sp. DCM]
MNDVFSMSYLSFGNTSKYIEQVDKTKGNLNMVAPNYFELKPQGTLKITSQCDPVFIRHMHERGITVVPFLSNHWDRGLGRAALAERTLLAGQCADFIAMNDLDGVNIDLENVTDADREAYTDFVRQLRERIPAPKEVSVAVAANPNGWTKGWHGSYDYAELAKYADYLLIMAYDESYTGGPEGPVAGYRWVERAIHYALMKGVPPEKIVLGIPFYGRYWKIGQAVGGIGISNKRVDELIGQYGGTVIFDDTAKSPRAVMTISGGSIPAPVAGKVLTPGTYHIWYENNDSIRAKLSLRRQYNLKGIGSWSLGQENPSLWQSYRFWIQ